jgi:hypothetical protein
MKEIKLDTDQKFIINGVEYNNINEIPEEFRKMIDKDKNGIIDFTENKSSNTIEAKDYKKVRTYKSNHPQINNLDNQSRITAVIISLIIGFVAGYIVATIGLLQ